MFCSLNIFTYNLGNHLTNPKLIGLSNTGKLVIGSSNTSMQYFNEGFSISDLKAIFNKLDIDGDGTLDRQELLQAVSNDSQYDLDDEDGVESKNGDGKRQRKLDLTKAVASAMLSSAASDADQDDGILTWEEFLDYFLPQVAKNGLTQAPQGLWRNRMGNVVNGKNINACRMLVKI